MNIITIVEIYLNSQATEDSLQILVASGLLVGFVVCLVQLV